MDSAERVVTSLPLTEMWDASGPLSLSRDRRLSVSDIAELLRTGVREFVVADGGRPLRWISGQECLDFWKREAKARIAEGDQIFLDEFPEGLAYVATSWRGSAGRVIVLFESHH